MPTPIPPAFGNQDFQQAMLALLPQGRVWRRDPDATLPAVLAALAPSYTRSTAAAAQLLIDADPATTQNLLQEWEASLGLPDPCTPLNATVLQRQAAVRAKFGARGSLSKSYFIELAASLGYSITITEFAPFSVGDPVGLPDCGIDWAFAWQINAPSVQPAYFLAGSNRAGDPLVTYASAAELICRMRRDTPAGTIVIFDFSGILTPTPPVIVPVLSQSITSTSRLTTALTGVGAVVSSLSQMIASTSQLSTTLGVVAPPAVATTYFLVGTSHAGDPLAIYGSTSPTSVTVIYPYITPGSGSFTTTAGNATTYAIDASGDALMNGAIIVGGQGSSAMELYNGLLYVQDATSGNWFTFDGSNFTAATAPPGSTSTTVTNPTITPGSGSFVSGGVTYAIDISGDALANGAIIAGGQGTAAMELYNGLVYAQEAASTVAYPYVTPGSGSFTSGSDTYAIDASGNALLNGAMIAGGQGTAAMELYNALVYAQDATSGSWYTFDGTNYTAATAPPQSSTATGAWFTFDGTYFTAAAAPPASTSTTVANPAVTPGSGSITVGGSVTYAIDADGNALADGVVIAGGQGTAAMELYNALVYIQNASTGNWSTFDGTNFTAATAPPRSTTTTTTGGGGSSATPRVVAPLTGPVTTGAWVAHDITVPGVTLPSGKPVHFELLLPTNYTPSVVYPVMIWLPSDQEGNPWYQGDPQAISAFDADGFYNNVGFRRAYPCICIVGYADQTTAGSEVQNWGGWINTGATGSGTTFNGETGPNVFAMNGVVNWVLANYAADPTRVYLAGFSLGGIGAEYLMLRYNTVNGSPPLYTAAMSTGGVVEIHGYGAGPSAADIATMAQVPVWWVSGAQDTTSQPGDWNLPMWRAQAGNSNYPAPGGTAIAAAAAATKMHFWYDPNIGHQQTDQNGNPYPVNSTILDWMFAQIGASTSVPVTPITPTANFTVKNGRIYDPSGHVYIAKGINTAGPDLGTVVATSPGLFPGLNHYRVPFYPQNPGSASAVYPAPESFLSAIEVATGYTRTGSTWTATNPTGIVIEFEDHNQDQTTYGALPPYTGTALSIQLAWYAAMGAYLNGNPYAWLGSPNEVATIDNSYGQAQIAAISTWESQIYNAIRGSGNTNIIQMMAGVGGSNIGTVGAGGGFTASLFAGMTNIVWEIHCYYTAGDSEGAIYSTATGYVNGGTSAPASGAGGGWGIIGAQTIQSADGVVPVIIGEWGSDSGNPNTTEASVLTAAVRAAQTASYTGATAWAYWQQDNNAWSLVGSAGGLTVWGQQVAGTMS